MSILGLRIGGTNSSAVVARGGERRVLPVRSGYDNGRLPTAIGLTDNIKNVIGTRALERQLYDFTSIAVGFAGALVRGEECRNSSVSPAELTTRFVKAVKDAASETIGTEVKACAVSIPAHFGMGEMHRLRAAVEAAGLDVLALIPDPVAFMLGAEVDTQVRSAAVIRMGGCGFDVGIVSQHSPWEVRACGGDPFLGGKMLDQALADWFLATQDAGVAEQVRHDVSRFLRVLRAAEQTKRQLSQRESARMMPVDESLLESRNITRPEFESIAQPVFEQAAEIVGKCFERAAIKPEDMDKVFLTGGSSQIPLFRTVIEERCGLAGVTLPSDAELVFAKGAALAGVEMCKAASPSQADFGAVELCAEPAEMPCSSAPHIDAPLPEASCAAGASPHLDENVQFTVYRPRAVEPEEWNDLLVFAHLDELPADAEEDEPKPIKKVDDQAQAILGKKIEAYWKSTHDSLAAVPREGEITYLPEMAGVTFKPERRTFVWTDERFHREEFQFNASAALDGQTAKGTLTVFLGNILLAQISLSIRVGREAAAKAKPAGADLERTTARGYRKIFASYSHNDLAIVEEFERYARTLGDVYLRDWTHLRAGELWNDRLEQMIAEADVFQLFWSWNAIESDFVAREYNYALSLNRPNFVRPTYWEDPLPARPDRNLPPENLRRLHFQRLPTGGAGAGTPQSHPALGDVDLIAFSGGQPEFRLPADDAEEAPTRGTAMAAPVRPVSPDAYVNSSPDKGSGTGDDSRGLPPLSPLSDLHMGQGADDTVSESGLTPLWSFDSEPEKDAKPSSFDGLPPLDKTNLEVPPPAGGLPPLPPLSDFDTGKDEGETASESALPPLPAFDLEPEKGAEAGSADDLAPLGGAMSERAPNPDAPEKTGFQDLAADSDFSFATPEESPGPDSDIDTPLLDSAFGAGGGSEGATPAFEAPAPPQAMEAPLFGEPFDQPGEIPNPAFDDGAFSPAGGFDAGPPIPDFSSDTAAPAEPRHVPAEPMAMMEAPAAKARPARALVILILLGVVLAAGAIFLVVGRTRPAPKLPEPSPPPAVTESQQSGGAPREPEVEPAAETPITSPNHASLPPVAASPGQDGMEQPGETDGAPAVRTLRFSEEPGGGRLYVRAWGSLDRWQKLTDAQGAVPIPQGMEVWLVVRQGGLSELAALPPDAFTMISIENLKIKDADFNHLKRFTGLRKLSLKGTTVSSTVLEDLRKALPNCTITQ